jgi:hypothetical protein
MGPCNTSYVSGRTCLQPSKMCLTPHWSAVSQPAKGVALGEYCSAVHRTGKAEKLYSCVDRSELQQKKRAGAMEEVMPELVGLVLTHYVADGSVDGRIAAMVCRAVCRQWNRLLSDEQPRQEAAAAVAQSASPCSTTITTAQLSRQMAARGSLAVLQWAHANGCALQRLSLGRGHLLQCGRGRPPRRAPVGALQWLPLGQ